MPATLDVPEQNPDLVLDQSADDYWNQYQLTFALYSVSDRAIPSAYDGLKPGQRRLLYQMHDSKLLPGNKPQKSSKVCSAVTGNLHPHGGASMYGAAALMAAEFQRVKVIDGQGAFPRIQGDIPAADFGFEVNGLRCGVESIGPEGMAEKAAGQFCLVDLEVTNNGGASMKDKSDAASRDMLTVKAGISSLTRNIEQLTHNVTLLVRAEGARKVEDAKMTARVEAIEEALAQPRKKGRWR